MKSIKSLAVILLTATLLSGCSLSAKPAVKDDTQEIAQILSRWQDLKDFSYRLKVDVITGQPIPDGTMDFFIKDKERTRADFNLKDQHLVTITNKAENINLMYFPKLKMYLDANSLEGSQSMQFSDNLENLYKQLAVGHKIISRETVDGKETIVIQGPGSDKQQEKIWVWLEKGAPLRYQKIDDQGKVILDFAFTDLKFEKLDDSLFLTPKDAKKTDINELYKLLGK